MGINGGEFLIILVIAMIVLGPSRLPEYAATLGRWVRGARQYAESAKNQFREEMGDEFDDVDWKQLDPRQYDPRRIVREALTEPVDNGGSVSSANGVAKKMQATARAQADRRASTEDFPPPYDQEAT